ncbi:MAG TPA: hypothetical protein VFB62_04280, partial [Polyangiaceae bacterium]|nr:hypothetical protein [Polyangiaceae bacterium]
MGRLFAVLLLMTTGCVVTTYETRRPPPTMVSESRPVTGVKEQPMRWWIGEARLFERGDGWTLPLVLDLGGQAPPDHPVRYRIDVALQVAYERVSDENGGPQVMRAVPFEG